MLPIGIRPPRLEQHLYKIGHEVFGRAEGLRCPYFAQETGGCSVWRYREAVCATWFCKYVEGEDGFRLWRAVRAYLEELEEALVTYALLELGFAGDRVAGWMKRRAGVAATDVDHRSTAEVLETIEERHGLRLTPRLVLKLHRQRILVEP